MTLFDYAVLTIMGVSVLLSVIRGFVREVLALASWVIAFFAASLLSGKVAEWLVGTIENLTPQLQSLAGAMPWLSSGVTLLAWVVWAVGALVLLGIGLAIHVAIALVRKSRQSTPLSVAGLPR